MSLAVLALSFDYLKIQESLFYFIKIKKKELVQISWIWIFVLLKLFLWFWSEQNDVITNFVCIVEVWNVQQSTCNEENYRN